jgi:hypothetical protein
VLACSTALATNPCIVLDLLLKNRTFLQQGFFCRASTCLLTHRPILNHFFPSAAKTPEAMTRHIDCFSASEYFFPKADFRNCKQHFKGENKHVAE